VGQVTSTVRGRGRAIGIVAAFAMTAALVVAPIASGAGDPIASGTLKFKFSSGFKKQLKKNHVKLKPKKYKIKTGSNLDPTTGAGLIRVGNITFKKGGEKLVFKNSKVTLGANGGKGSLSGSAKGATKKIFKLKGGTVTRDGFGAKLNGVKLTFQKGAAKKINKALGLHSLHKGSAGKLTTSESPQTVAVTSGFVNVAVPFTYLPATFAPPSGPGLIPGSGTDPNTVAAKQSAHCISEFAGAPVIPGNPSNPARETTGLAPDPVLGAPPAGFAALYRFPVTGGTISPAATDGALQLSGGIRLQTGRVAADGLAVADQPGSCARETPGAATSHSFLNTEFNNPSVSIYTPSSTNVGPNLGQKNTQSYVTIGGTSPGCNGTGAGTPASPTGCGAPLGGAGFKGVSIGQTLDTSGQTVSADPNAKTVAVSGTVIKNNATTAAVLNQLFPNASGNAALNFADGDKFGISSVTVNTR
jgi:hypothetical protein